MFSINYHGNIIAISCIDWNLLWYFAMKKWNLGGLAMSPMKWWASIMSLWLHSNITCLQRMVFDFTCSISFSSFSSLSLPISVCLSVCLTLLLQVYLFIRFIFILYLLFLSVYLSYCSTLSHSFSFSTILSVFLSLFLSFFLFFFFSFFLSFLNPNTFFLGRLPTPSIGSL